MIHGTSASHGDLRKRATLLPTPRSSEDTTDRASERGKAPRSPASPHRRDCSISQIDQDPESCHVECTAC